MPQASGVGERRRVLVSRRNSTNLGYNGTMRQLTVAIDANVDNLTQAEHDQLTMLLKKLGFTDVGIGGGELDTHLELTGPGVRALESVTS